MATSYTSHPQVSDEQVIETMLVYGGNFVQALARAWQAGDPTNRETIKYTWFHYWKHYANLYIRFYSENINNNNKQ